MKVLVVASGNAKNLAPFITDQVDSLKKVGIEAEYFLIKGKGILGYLKNFKKYLRKINSFDPVVIHAHYGLSGLFAAMQSKVPVITTFHGSDINVAKARIFSRLALKRSARSIFVSLELANLIGKKDPIVIPCGVDMDVFYERNQELSREQFDMDKNKYYVLFSSNFKNQVKNYPLARQAIDLIKEIEVELIELKGFTRKEVAILMNAVNAVLMTSKTEGSPQFIKEAMACNTPVISTNVGDVKEVLGTTKGCYIAENDPIDLKDKIVLGLQFNGRTEGRKNIVHLDNLEIANKIADLYREVTQ